MTETETILESNLLKAEMNEQYFRILATREARYDRIVQCLAAVTSLSAGAAWLSAHGKPAEEMWGVVMLISAVLSSLSPIVRWFDSAVKFTDLAARWTGIAGRIRVLGISRLDDSELRARLIIAASDMEALEREDTSRVNRKLVNWVQDQISARHGLETSAGRKAITS